VGPCAAVLAYLVAALSPSMEVANAALPTYVVTLLFFAGFLLRWKNIPNYWKWCVSFTLGPNLCSTLTLNLTSHMTTILAGTYWTWCVVMDQTSCPSILLCCMPSD